MSEYLPRPNDGDPRPWPPCPECGSREYGRGSFGNFCSYCRIHFGEKGEFIRAETINEYRLFVAESQEMDFNHFIKDLQELIQKYQQNMAVRKEMQQWHEGTIQARIEKQTI